MYDWSIARDGVKSKDSNEACKPLLPLLGFCHQSNTSWGESKEFVVDGGKLSNSRTVSDLCPTKFLLMKTARAVKNYVRTARTNHTPKRFSFNIF